MTKVPLLFEPSWKILFEVLVLLSTALILGTLAKQLRQSTILGYLAAGTLVGPNVIGLVESSDHVTAIAELGVALLLFTIGLEFSFRRLRRLGALAFLGGSLQVVITLLIASMVAASLGLGLRGALGVGAIIALSSTVCVLQILRDRTALDSVYGRNALGILLMQDVAVIPLMLAMTMLTSGDTWTKGGMTLLRTLLLGGGLIGVFYLVFNFAVPRIINLRHWSRDHDLPILLAIVVILSAVIAAHHASISPAMGAFIAGVLLGGSPFAVQIRADVGSIRTIFVTLFFASIGLLGNPGWVLDHLLLVLGLVPAIMIGKTLIIWGIVRILGFSSGMALATGLCLAQVGEFSFLLAEAAHGTIIDDTVFHLLVSAMIITLFLTPFLATSAPRLANLIKSRRHQGVKADPPTGDDASRSEMTDPCSEADILIIGYGPAGQRAARSLQRKYMKRIGVIDLSPHLADAAKRVGFHTLVGDACRRELLEHAHVQHMALIMIAVPDPETCRTIIHHCKFLAPNTPIVARSRYATFQEELQQAGALEVINEEEHVGYRIAAAAHRLLRRAAANQ